jgi:predicted RNase H-like nuclease (RuvC/YqgF family)
MRDIKPLLLVLLSIGLVGTWSYHLYDKTRYSQQRHEVLVKDSAAVADAIKDSLTLIFSSTIQQLDRQLLYTDSSLSYTRQRADSLQKSLSGRMREIERLRGEINNLLGKGGKVSGGDMALARKKIEELQQQVAQLETQKAGMETEKDQLTRTLDELSRNASNLEQSIRQLSEENASLAEKIQLATLFVANDIKLAAIDRKSSSKEVETSLARKAEKLQVSFTLQNKVQDFSNAEISVSIIQPNREVLQNAAWDSGEMTTSEGSRKFTRKVRFDYTRDELKSLSFTLDVPEFQKGNYVLELWHKGHLLGKTVMGLR